MVVLVAIVILGGDICSDAWVVIMLVVVVVAVLVRPTGSRTVKW